MIQSAPGTKTSRFLDGITRRPGSGPHFSNPREAHSHFAIRNRIVAECWGPDPKGDIDPKTGNVRKILKRRVERFGNIACTYGLDQMAQLFSSDTNGASKICSAMAIGTDTTAANSTQSSCAGSTQIVYLSQASMVASYPGTCTLQYNATFASNGNACTINEVGLFGTTAATNKMIARSVLGASSINRGTADEIRCSYQLIFST